MFRMIGRTAVLVKTPLSNSLPAFSTTQFLGYDPTQKHEAPLIDPELVVLPEKAQERNALETIIAVPDKVDLTPVSGVPEEHIKGRRVRIYKPTKNAMQSGTHNIHHWQMEFDNRQRWENPLMGWTSTGDPLSNMKIAFPNPEKAIEHCEKNGWQWYIDCPKTDKPVKPKSYGVNFSWNRRTRVSTK